MFLLRFIVDNAPYLAAGALLTLLSSFGQTFFISIFAGEIRATFGLSHGAWGGIYTLGTTASAVAMVWAGGLTDRYRARVLGSAVLGLLAFACVFLAATPFAALLPLAVFLLRFAGQGMVNHIAVVAMTRWFVASRGKALSVARLGFSLGEAVLPLIFVAAMTVVDWRWLWIASAGAALAMIPVLRRLLRLERTPQALAEEDDSFGMQGRHWTRAEVLKHPLFWLMCPAILGPSAWGTALFFHQVHLAEIKGWSHLQFVALFPVYTGLTVVTMIGVGLLQDRFGTHRLMAVSLLPLVVGFAVFGLSTSLVWASVAFAFLALNAAAFSTLPPAFWAEFYGTRHIGGIKALTTAVMVLGSAIGPGVTGVLIDIGFGLERQFLWFSLYFLFATGLAVLGITKARRDMGARVER